MLISENILDLFLRWKDVIMLYKSSFDFQWHSTLYNQINEKHR